MHKTHSIVVRVTPGDRHIIEAAARQANETLSDFVRRCVLAVAAAVAEIGPRTEAP